jgi:translation initiation factor IF-3
MGNKFKNKKESFPTHRLNSEIRGNYEVRVVYPTNYVASDIHYWNLEFTSEVMDLNDAKKLANSLNLDIFEINPNLNPPIMRIDDYDKWSYREKKKLKEGKQNKTELKEIQLSTNIGKHDLEIKANKAKEFITDGDKVKVVLTMKNRELSRREESKRCLYEFILMVEDVATPESMPRDEGSKTIVILKKKK